MELQDIPFEIAVHIFHFLPTEDLANISRSCLQLHQIVEPVLYSNFEQNRWSAIPLLLRTILDKPHVAQHIKHVTFFHLSKINHVQESRVIGEILNIDHFERLGSKIQDYFGHERGGKPFLEYKMGATPEEMLDSWTILFQGSHEPGGMAGLLLLHLSNIQEIKIFTLSLGDLDIHSILDTAVKTQRGQLTSTRYSYSRLRKVTINTCVKNHPYVRTQINTLLPPMKTLLPLIEMPSLRTFSCRKLDIDRRHPEPIVLHTTSSVKHLELKDCNVTVDVLGPLLLKCPSLTYLRVDFYAYEDDSANLYFSNLINTIAHLSSKLQKLVVFDRYHRYMRDYTMRFFPSLTHFQSLYNLKIEACFIGTNEQIDNSRTFTFASLPPVLEKLTIWNLDRALLVEQLDRNLHLLNYVPGLKKVCLLFQHQFDRWEPFNMNDIENEIWKKFAKKYSERGVELIFKICNYTSKEETAHTKMSYRYDRVLYPAWKFVSRLVVEREPCSACDI